MKELREIVRAFDKYQEEGFKSALATVVHVFGSAYRHEGARMLICENGELTGAISGGCLEGDALRKARQAMFENRKMLVTYDTTDDDDAIMGMGLGCNGIIQVLLEPIDIESSSNPVELFRSFLSKRQYAVLGTFFSLQDRSSIQLGTSLLFIDSDVMGDSILDEPIKEQFIEDSKTVLQNQGSFTKEYSAENQLRAFIEYLKPPVQLLVFGAGNDAVPVVQIASILGWEVIVVDGRPQYANRARFPGAKQVVLSKSDSAFDKINVDDHTVSVIMTHNYNYDIEMLRQSIVHDIRYIGALGPKKKLNRMLGELSERGFEISEEHLSKIFGPTGLDIGSESPEEIALSIIAEIKAVLSNRNGSSLKYKTSSLVEDETKFAAFTNTTTAACSVSNSEI